MATVAEQPLVQSSEKTWLYMCRRSNLRLIRIPRGTLINPATGQREVGAVPGQAVAFHEGVLRVEKDGEVTLEDGSTAPSADILEWLDKHRLNGNVEEGFWRVDPTAPPVSQDEMRTLMQAALALDEDTLRRIAEEEREGWGRSAIIEEAESALGSIEAMREAERAQALAEAEAAKAEAKPKGTAAK